MVCVQEGSGCCDHQAENFHVVTQHGCAVLLKQGHLRAQLLVCAALHPLQAQVRHMGRPRQVVLLLHGRQRPHQQRVRQKAVRVHRVVAAHPGPVPQARRSAAHLRFQRGCGTRAHPWCLREPAPHFRARASLQFGTCCLAHLGGEPYGNKWLECCGFVVLPGSQKDWLILCQLSWASRPPTRRGSGQPLIS